MATSAGNASQHLTVIGLKDAASQADADPCDIACDALPARVVGHDPRTDPLIPPPNPQERS